MTDLNGSVDSRFNGLYDMLNSNLEAGKELGASLYVEVEGEPVIDLWGGWQDEDKTRSWSEDTVVNVFSGSKTVTALAVLTLVDRGLISVDAPVARYWPEFGANGKENVLVRHILSHTSGVSGWETPFAFEDALDTEESTARLAAQEPWWEPGSASCYHASTFGHLNAELVRRVSGSTLAEFIRAEIAGPLDADYYLGVSDLAEERIATVYPLDDGPAPEAKAWSESPRLEDQINAKTRAGSFSANVPVSSFELFNSPLWRATEFGGSSGHTNAKGLGRILSTLANGGTAHGIDLLSQSTIDTIFREQANDVDMYYRKPIRWGIGYALTSAEGNRKGPLPFLRTHDSSCFWYGTGGSLGIADVENRITISYAMNRCKAGKDSLNGHYYRAIYECLGL